MKHVVGVNVAILQMGTHVGVHIDFVCDSLRNAVVLRDEMQIRAEAAKLLAQLGFDMAELGGLWEVGVYGTEEI